MTSKMTTKTPLLVLGLAIGLFWAGPAAAQRIKDTIVCKDGRQIRGVEVLSMTVDKVTYKQKGSDTVISASQVERVKWDDPPEAYRQAEVAESLGRFEDAAQLYLTAAKADKARDVIKLEARFLAGRAYLRTAGPSKTKAEAAGTTVEEYVAAAPDGFHLPEARIILGKVKIMVGDAGAAEDLMTTMVTDASKGGWPNHWVAQAQFVKAQAQSAQGKHDDARNSYRAVVSTSEAALGEGPLNNQELLALQVEAKVMQGETFIQQKYYDDALAYFRTLAATGGAGLKAAGKAGEGQILYLKGKDKGDSRLLRQAQLALAEAAVEADTNPNTSAKALFYMGKVLQGLGDKETNGLARAKSYFESVTISYPRTSWASRAKKELEG